MFSVRYRAGSRVDRGPLPPLLANRIEGGWTLATLFLALFFFWWAATLDARTLWPPADALEIHIEAKQWIWKATHPSGAREINALHVPVDSILLPRRDVVAGYAPIMPSFAGLLAPGEVAALVAYVSGLGRPEPVGATPDLVSPAMGALVPPARPQP